MNYSTPIIGDIQAHPEQYLNYEYTENKTDGTVKKCVQDTNFSPEDYPQAWEITL